MSTMVISPTFVYACPGPNSTSRLTLRRPRAEAPQRSRLGSAYNNFTASRCRITAKVDDVPPDCSPSKIRSLVTCTDLEPERDCNSPSSDSSHNHSSSASRHAQNHLIEPENIALDDDSNSAVPDVVPVNLLGFSFGIPARWLLYSVPFMWGSFGPSVRLLFQNEPHIDAPVFNTARLFLSSLIYLPILANEVRRFRSPDQENDLSFITAGLELGVYVFLANVCQVLGLESVSAGRAAFLVQCQTVIVPVLAGVLGLEVIRRSTWISSFVAIAGVALLSLDHGAGTASSVTGDGLELLSAFFFSTYILRLAQYCNTVRPSPLVATKILVQAVLSMGWATSVALMKHPDIAIDSTSSVPGWTWPIVALNLGVVAWTGIVSSAISGWAQTKGQQLVPASEAVVVFATQPLWASAISGALLGESFGARGIAGGALIVASTLISGRDDSENDGKVEGREKEE